MHSNEVEVPMVRDRLLSAAVVAALMCSPSIPTVAAGLKFHTDTTRALVVEAPGLYPEGIEYNPATGEFLLGSIRKGKVVAVAPDGSVRTLVEDARLRSVVGIRIDRQRGRLIVTNSDYGVAERSVEADKFAIAAIGIYDLASGKPIHYVDLSNLRAGEKRFVNDVAVDSDGSAYVTDSLAATIYKVTPDGQSSVFLAHERFRGQGFNLNGIQVHPDGFLLVAKKSDGALFKIPLAHPDSFSEVSLPQPVVGTDGLVLASGSELVAIANVAGNAAPNTAYRLVSSDGWASARIEGEIATGDVYATTGTIKSGKLYVSNGWLHTLPATLKDKSQHCSTFRIVELGVL